MTAPSYLDGVARRSDRSVPRLRPPFILYPPPIGRDSTATLAQAGSQFEPYAADMERSRVAPQSKAAGGRRGLAAPHHRLHETAAAAADTRAAASGIMAGRPVPGTDGPMPSVVSYGPIVEGPLETIAGEALVSPRARV